MKIVHFFRRHHFFYWARFFLIIRKPSKADFLEEHCNKYVKPKSIPKIFKQEIENICTPGVFDSLERALRISLYMNENYGRGRGLGYSTVENLRLIKNKMGGVCSDYSNVFIALCIASGINVREWGMTYRFYYGKEISRVGHSFNEVFSQKDNKWVMIDPYYAIYFVDKSDRIPLSATELIDRLTMGRGDQVKTVYLFNNSKKYIDKMSSRLATIYNRENIYFLLKRNKIFLHDKILKYNKILPLPFSHFLLLITNRYYRFLVYTNKYNYPLIRAELKKIFRYGNWLGN